MRQALSNIKKLVVAGLNTLPMSSTVIGVPRKMVSIYKVDSEHEYVVKEDTPVNSKKAVLNDEQYQQPFDEVAKRVSPKQVVKVLGNGRVWGMNGAVVTKDDEFVFDVSREFGINGDYKKHSVFHNFSLGAPKKYKGNVAVVTTAGANVYYHWILDVLPRLLMLKELGLLEHIDHIVMNYDGARFQKATLDVIGVKEGQIINCKGDRNFHIEADYLYVPTLLSALSQVNLYECDLLKKYFLGKTATTSVGKRVYVSRKKNGTRTIVNEEEFWSFIKGYGFEEVLLEDYSIAEQAVIFNKAELIVGAHGSAYANMAFSTAATTLVDILPETNLVPCFYNICEQVGAKYLGYVDKAKAINDSVKNDCIEVDMDRFKKFFEQHVA